MVLLIPALCWVRGSAQEKAPIKKMRAPKAAVTEKAGSVKSWTVEGWGKSVEDAEKHAVKNAYEQVATYLKTLKPPLAWTPSAQEVRKKLFTGDPLPCPDQEKQQIDGEQVQCWSWTVSLTSAQLDDMRLEDARYRVQLAKDERAPVAEARSVALGKLVVLVVVGLSGLWLLMRIFNFRGRASVTV
jgi:hypothetical protein